MNAHRTMRGDTKVSVVSPRFYLQDNGLEIYADSVARSLEVAGYDVDFLSTTEATELHNRSSMMAGVRVSWFKQLTRVERLLGQLADRAGGRVERASILLRRLSHGPLSLGLAVALIRSRSRVVVAIGAIPASSLMAVVLARLRLCPPVVLAGLIHLRPDGSMGSQHRALSAHADAYVALTEFERRGVISASGLDPGLVFCIAPPLTRVDSVVSCPPRVSPHAATAESVPTGPAVIGYVGRLTPRKNVLVLIDAFELICRSDSTVRLVLAGSTNKGTSEVEARVAALPSHVRRRVELIVDFQSGEKAAIYERFDIFVNPSANESFGMVFVEAWNFGLPVVGARIPSVSCLINHDDDGLLVDPGNADDLAAAIDRLLRDPQLSRRLGESGHRRVGIEFSLEASAKSWHEVVEAAARDRRWFGKRTP